MKIESIHFIRLRNEEHFQFHSEFKGLVVTHKASTLNIETAFNAYLPLYSQEAEALNKIIKSSLTSVLADADKLRDNTFMGLSDAVSAAARHFRPEVKLAAQRMMVVFNHYNGLTRRNYDQESAAINTFIAELNSSCADDITTIGVGDWVSELQSNNDNFINLMKTRYTEEAGKTQYEMKEVRIQIDNAYRSIIKRIDALMTINGESDYTAFVRELNERIDRINNQISQHRSNNNPAPPVV